MSLLHGTVPREVLMEGAPAGWAQLGRKGAVPHLRTGGSDGENAWAHVAAAQAAAMSVVRRNAAVHEAVHTPAHTAQGPPAVCLFRVWRRIPE